MPHVGLTSNGCMTTLHARRVAYVSSGRRRRRRRGMEQFYAARRPPPEVLRSSQPHAIPAVTPAEGAVRGREFERAGWSSLDAGLQRNADMISRCLVTFIFTATGCVAATRSPSAPSAPSAATSCTFDSQCPLGSCRAGECSSFQPDPATCAFDSQCPAGSCQAGSCSPFPPGPATCAFDSQCPGGSCQAGSCSPFPTSSS